MSQDYQDYEQLCVRNRLLAFVWRVGDLTYYLGFLGGLMVASAAPLNGLFSWLKGAPIGLPLWSPFGLGLFCCCVLLALIGPELKEFARRTSGIE